MSTEKYTIHQHILCSIGQVFPEVLQFQWNFGVALARPETPAIRPVVELPDRSRILYMSVLIRIRYAAFKRHPE